MDGTRRHIRKSHEVFLVVKASYVLIQYPDSPRFTIGCGVHSQSGDTGPPSELEKASFCIESTESSS